MGVPEGHHGRHEQQPVQSGYGLHKSTDCDVPVSRTVTETGYQISNEKRGNPAPLFLQMLCKVGKHLEKNNGQQFFTEIRTDGMGQQKTGQQNM